MGFLLHVLEPEDTFIDVGANVGSYTILASGVCGATTIAFEPDPVTAAFLRRNIEINKLVDRVSVHEMALGDTTGEIEFTVGRDTTNHVAFGKNLKTRRVRIGRLDDIVGGRSAVFMKIDVEGYEAHVIAGADGVLNDPSFIAVQSEGQGCDVISALHGHGFEQAFYDPVTRALSKTDLGVASSNGLFIRDWEAVNARVVRAPKREIVGRLI